MRKHGNSFRGKTKLLPIESKNANAASFAFGKESSMLPLSQGSSSFPRLDKTGLQGQNRGYRSIETNSRAQNHNLEIMKIVIFVLRVQTRVYLLELDEARIHITSFCGKELIIKQIS